jgi:Phosphoglycerate dehydrogenase and related dehydrogenases
MKVVVTDCEYESLHIEQEAMERIGASFVAGQCKNEAELIAQTTDSDGVFVQYANISRRVIENMKHCRAIVRYGIGIDCVDVKAATDHGIMVVNVPDYGLQDVADHTVTLLLSAARKIVLLNNEVKAGNWDYKKAKPVSRLEGKTLGLIAFGHIARMVAARAKPFGLHVQAYDPGLDEEALQKYAVTRVDFDTLLATSDFISLHAPLLPSTRNMLNKEAFRQMKKNAVLINTARGGLVDEEALVMALQKGCLAGAALDVTLNEPININNPLLSMDNVIITPHSAWYTEEAQKSLQLNATADMVRALSGDIPVNLLNPEVLNPSL